MDDKGFLSRMLKDVSVGSRNTVYLIKRICGNEDFVHTGFSQRNVTVFLQKLKNNKIKFLLSDLLWRILIYETKHDVKEDLYGKLSHSIKESR
jgi:hypothetical protein